MTKFSSYHIIRQHSHIQIIPVTFVEMSCRGDGRVFITQQYCSVRIAFDGNGFRSGEDYRCKPFAAYLIYDYIFVKRLAFLDHRECQHIFSTIHQVHNSIYQMRCLTCKDKNFLRKLLTRTRGDNVSLQTIMKTNRAMSYKTKFKRR